MDLLRKVLGLGLVVCSVSSMADSVAKPTGMLGIMVGTGSLYSTDVNGITENSESASVQRLYYEREYSESITVHIGLGGTKELCFRNDCNSFYISTDSIEASAKYSQELTPNINWFGRLGAHAYRKEGMLGAWHLAHNDINESGLGAAAAIGVEFNPHGKFRVGFEYDILTIKKTENLRTLLISFGIPL